MPIDPRATGLTGLLGLLGQPAAQQGFGQRLQQGFANNSNTLATIGAGLLAHRQNATRPMFGDPRDLMYAQAADQERMETQRKQEEEAKRQNQTVQWLRRKDPSLTEDDALAIIGEPAILSDWLKSDDPAEGVNFGLTPIWGKDADGRDAIGVLGDDGTFKPIDTGGFEPSPRGSWIDTGTSRQFVDNFGGAGGPAVPIDIAGREAEEARGKAVGEAEAALPAAMVSAEQTIAKIDSVIGHPGRETATGMSGTLDPRNYMAGTDATNFRVRLQQLSGESFLQARQLLKGGGQITDFESGKAEAAVARMNTAQSDEEFIVALKDFRDAVAQGVQKLQMTAGQQPTFQAPAPAVDLRQKYRLE